MKLSRPLPNAKRALQMAKARNLFPTTAGTRELRTMEREFLRRSVFSATVTNTRFLQAVKTRVERLLRQDEPDVGRARRELRGILKEMGYTPEKGFGADAPVAPGSIQDLTSSARLNLILETQIGLMSGHAQRQHGRTPSSIARAPAWELVRVKDSAAPRDWLERWEQAGGRPTSGKLIAAKGSEIWSVLGDSALFDDALNVDHPPFAFNSGMAWASVGRKRAEALGIVTTRTPEEQAALPDLTMDVSNISRPLLRKLRDKLRSVEAAEAAPGKLKVSTAKQPTSPEPEPDSPANINPPRRSRAIFDRIRAEFNAALNAALNAA
jgi:hypothetical protein